MRIRRVCVPLAKTPVVVAAAVGSVTRAYSEARSNYDGTSAPPWPAPGQLPRYPSALAPHPLPRPRLRRTHTEWMFFHGHGGRPGRYGPSREIADFEFADGTPASLSSRRFAFKHHQDYLLVQLIRAGAAVEDRAARDRLPRVPGTAEQRSWDPAIPLFLEDVDEHGRPPPTPNRQRDMCNRVIDERLGGLTPTPNDVANRHQGETLEVNEMFASYDPGAFVSDSVKLKENKRPFWSRRRWALTDKFLVSKSPKAKNTIKDE